VTDGDRKRASLLLRRVRDASHRLVGERDRGRLVPGILEAAVSITGAERAFLVRTDRGRDGRIELTVLEAFGFAGGAALGPEGSVSRSAVDRVAAEDRGVVTSAGVDADLLRKTSVHGRSVRSIACVPLHLRGELRGVLYLDHTRAGVFLPVDLTVLQIFADQAALALETVELGPGAALSVEAGRRVASGLPSILRFGGLVGGSRAMLDVYEQVRRAARTWAPVLIRGPAGAGKSAVAREVHERTERAGSAFHPVPCAGQDGDRLAGELFGVRKGAVPGAARGRRGALVRAGWGTVVVEEVAELPLALQGRLLAALEEGQVRPVGGEDRPAPLKCRLLATTSRDLGTRVASGAFREELFYRLDVLRIDVPPLAARPEDVSLLFHAVAEGVGCPELRPDPDALGALQRYAWPGNVRELRNLVVRLAARGVEQVGGAEVAQELARTAQPSESGRIAPPPDRPQTLGEVERAMVEEAMRACRGNKSQAARRLGIPRTTLYLLLERYELTDRSWK